MGSLGLVHALGWRQAARWLLGGEKQAQGMADNLIATGFETDAGLQRIEIAVERLAQGDGDTHRQDAGGFLSCGTDFIQEIFFVNRKWQLVKFFGFGQQAAARAPRRVISRVGREDAQGIGCEAEAVRPLGGRSHQRYGLGPV